MAVISCKPPATAFSRCSARRSPTRTIPNALYAALRMQEEVRRYGDRMPAQGQTPIQVRIGINTGEVVVRSIQTSAGHTEYTPIGHSTSLAARLQTLATPGSTVIISTFPSNDDERKRREK